jgi:small-conductance mechanosensitive channel
MDADTLLNLTNMINTSLGTIEKVKEEKAKLSEMLKSLLDNDPSFLEASEQAKTAGKAKGQARKQVMRMPQASDLDSKFKELSKHLKDITTQMSMYLADYARLSGLSTFEDPNGEVREIVYVAKLVKKS